MATGLGKTVIFSRLAEQYSEHGKVMVLAHREELVFQAANHLDDLNPGIEMADQRDATGLYRSRVVVGTIQSVSRKSRLAKINPNDYSLLIIDEAHHASATTYKRVIGHFLVGGTKVLGVTATPYRTDKRTIASIFDTEAYRYTIVDAIKDGWLVPVKQFFVTNIKVDFSTIKVRGGDFCESDLERVISEEKQLHAIAHVAIDASPNGPVIIYTPGVKSAQRCAEIINRYRPNSAEAIHATQDKTIRRGIIASFREGKLPILVNCMIATEGFDCPQIATIIVARPTQSRSLYTQILGRGTRPLPGIVDGISDPIDRKKAIASSGKPHLCVIDMVPRNRNVKLITSYDVLADTTSFALIPKLVTDDRMVEYSREKADEIDDVISQIEQWKEEERARLELGRADIVCNVTYKLSVSDPFQMVNVDRIVNIDGEPPSEGQLRFLKKAFKIDIDPATTTRAATSELINTLLKRKKEGLASYRQIKVLVAHKVPQSVAILLTHKEASKLIDSLVRGRWAYFAGVKPPRDAVELERYRKEGYYGN